MGADGSLLLDSDVTVKHLYISARRHAGGFLEDLTEILRIVSAAYHIRHILNGVKVGGRQYLLGAFYPHVRQVSGEFTAGFF